MDTDVFVAIPWRDRGSEPSRMSLMHVTKHLMGITGRPVHHADGSQERFSLAAARNDAVRQGMAEGANVIVICDADTLVAEDSLISAIIMAREVDRVVLPFDLFRALGPGESMKVMNGRDPLMQTDIGSLTWSVGGIQVTTPDAWWALGGQDERFTGWGCEDTAFALVADRLNRSHVRVPGAIHHLWHPHPDTRDPESESYRLNAALLQRYVDATNIEDIIREHHG